MHPRHMTPHIVGAQKAEDFEWKGHVGILCDAGDLLGHVLCGPEKVLFGLLKLAKAWQVALPASELVN